ncbi:hypothetical protein EBME_0894 [bacterium endosymbiont of Mortierella elongata FMR23-6]|nr:hypothetical protein EBME_0894 [bacterium endosymbiont of Mortierella elongata FMR23-6]
MLAKRFIGSGRVWMLFEQSVKLWQVDKFFCNAFFYLKYPSIFLG